MDIIWSKANQMMSKWRDTMLDKQTVPAGTVFTDQDESIWKAYNAHQAMDERAFDAWFMNLPMDQFTRLAAIMDLVSEYGRSAVEMMLASAARQI